MEITNEDELPLEALRTVTAIPYGTWWMLTGFVLKDGRRFLSLAPVLSYDAEFGKGVGSWEGLNHDMPWASDSGYTGDIHLFGPLTALKVAGAMRQLPRRTRAGLSAADMGPWTLEDFDFWSVVTLHAEGIISDEDVRGFNMGDELTIPRKAKASKSDAA